VNEERPPRAALLALLLLSILPYLASLGGGVVYDDEWVVADERVQKHEFVAALSDPYWPEGAGGLYRPVTTTSLVVNGLLSLRPWSFRAGNVCLHAAAVMVAWALARRIVRDRRVAWIAAALFAVHPIHVESVAQVGGRGETLAFVAGGLAWLLARDGGIGRIAGATALALASLLSKESGVGIALAAAVDAAADPRGEKRVRAIGRSVLPWLIALVPALIARHQALGDALLPTLANRIPPFMNPLIDQPLGVRLANVPVLLAFYLGKLAWPFGTLSWDYGGGVVELARGLDARAGISVCVIGVALGAAAAMGARGAVLGLGLFAALLATALQVVPIGTFAADRICFSASFGFAIFAAELLVRLRGVLTPRALRVVVALALGALAGESARIAPIWGDNARFYALGVERAPRSAQVRLDSGLWHGQEAMRAPSSEEAKLQWRVATRDLGIAVDLAKDELGGDEPYVLESYGKVLVGAERPSEAEGVLRRALALGGRAPKTEASTRFFLASALQQQGRSDEAREELERSVALYPTDRSCMNLAVLLRERDPRRARALFEKSLELSPDQPFAKEIRAEIEKLPR
jgi:tetratricopeptide (TPR) repeat protein